MDIRKACWTSFHAGAIFLFLLPQVAHGQELTRQLHSAARAADHHATQSLLELGVAVDARDAYNWTALMLVAAINSSSPEQAEQTTIAARTLIEAGADVNARSIDGWSPLHFAAALSNNPAVVDILLDAGAEIESRTMESWSAEMTLARYTGEQRLQRSIGPGAAPGSQVGYTPLIAAVRFGSPELVKALLRAGADPSARDERNRNACDYGRDKYGSAGQNMMTPDLVELLCPQPY